MSRRKMMAIRFFLTALAALLFSGCSNTTDTQITARPIESEETLLYAELPYSGRGMSLFISGYMAPTLFQYSNQWEDVRARSKIDNSTQLLEELTRELRDDTPYLQIIGINAAINSFSYIEEPPQTDQWLTYAELIDHAGGDCEDFAIAKYRALRLLGFNTNDLMILIVFDPHIGQRHALLLVRHRGTVYILDNELTFVQPYRTTRYTLLYGFNEIGWREFHM